jgi:hypothetical protein
MPANNSLQLTCYSASLLGAFFALEAIQAKFGFTAKPAGS